MNTRLQQSAVSAASSLKVALAACLVATAVPAIAADTLETWDAGSGDIDFYLTLDGMGQDPASQAVAGDMLLGWGVADRLSTYLSLSMMADGYLGGGGAAMGAGLFGTPLDTDHVDVDLVLDLAVGGRGLSELCIGPALELNLDAAPDRATWGVYARAGLSAYGSAPAEADKDGATEPGYPSRLVDGLLTVGGYLMLDARRQLLVEYDVTYLDEPAPGEPGVNLGGLALGFNQVLNDRLEFVTQARYDVPQVGEAGALGITIGFIATMPGGGGTHSEVLP